MTTTQTSLIKSSSFLIYLLFILILQAGSPVFYFQIWVNISQIVANLKRQKNPKNLPFLQISRLLATGFFCLFKNIFRDKNKFSQIKKILARVYLPLRFGIAVIMQNIPNIVEIMSCPNTEIVLPSTSVLYPSIKPNNPNRRIKIPITNWILPIVFVFISFCFTPTFTILHKHPIKNI